VAVHQLLIKVLWPAPILVFACSPAAAGTANTVASAEIISPAEISAQQATQLLFSPTPGVLTITIPGSSGSSTLDLTATGVDAATGTFTFSVAGGSLAALTELMEQLAAGVVSGSLSTGLTVSGFINGQGVQIVVLEASQAGDGGSLKATITFD